MQESKLPIPHKLNFPNFSFPRHWLILLLPFMRWWPRVNRGSLRADAIAGLLGAIVVLPQGVAFATLAGLPPQYGLYAAMIPAVIAALFGSSWHLVSGPTNVISIFIFASLSPLAEPGSAEYIRLVLTLTFLTGIFQLVMGLARMGALVNFISHTVVVSFTTGAAFLIFAVQIENFFGINIPRGASFADTWVHFYAQITVVNPYVTAVGAITLLAGLGCRKYYPKIPYMIAAMLIGSLFAVALNAFFGHDITHIPTVGALSGSLPELSQPDLSADSIKKTLPVALAVTILALTEAVSIARAIGVKSGQRIDGNQEFIGQGLSNFAGSFFSAYAASGSFNRTGLNYESGARTPLAAVFSALALIAVLLLIAPLAQYLPLAVMAAILFMVAYGLIDAHYIKAVFKTSRQEIVVMLITFFSALFADLEFAIYAGVLLSLMLYLTRTSRPLILDVKPDPGEGSYHYSADTELPDCPQVKMLRINGSIFFGAVDHVQRHFEEIDEINHRQKHLLIVCSGINFVDMPGAEMLVQESRRRRMLGGGLYFYRVKNEVQHLLDQGGYMTGLGKGNFFPVRTRPVSYIYTKLDSEICRHCKVKIFRECHERLPNGEPLTPPLPPKKDD